jgi:hypothetical protein
MSEAVLLKPGDVLLCPHCGKPPDGSPGDKDLAPAADYIIPLTDGRASYSETDCGWCDGKFSAIYDQASDTITVRAR